MPVSSQTKPSQTKPSSAESPLTKKSPKSQPKSSAHYQREFRKRLREQGLVKKEAWIIPENSKLLAFVEKELRQHIEPPSIGHASQLVGSAMLATNPPEWKLLELYEAFSTTDLAVNEQASFSLLDEHTIEIVLHELGDLPLLLTIAGHQMLVEAVLWSVKDVADIAAFDAAILRTHKYFPLSTIAIDSLGEKGDFYILFGALSTQSLLANIILEIETLGANMMQAVSAYSEYLHPTLRKTIEGNIT